MGLAKKMQIWLKKLTKLNPKVRIRKTTGEAEESDDGADIPDDMLKVDPAEAAAKAAAGKEFMKRLAELGPDIKKAMSGPTPDEIKKHIKELIDSVTKHGKAKEFDEAVDELDEIEAALEEAAEAAANVSSFDDAEVRKALQALSDSRKTAVTEVTGLVKALLAAFEGEKAQQGAVIKAAQQLGEASKLLNATTLEKQVSEALAEKNASRRAQLANKAKTTIDSVQKLLDEHKVISNLDKNEIVSNMVVVQPLRERLQEVADALG
jgi:hypothetical protein